LSGLQPGEIVIVHHETLEGEALKQLLQPPLVPAAPAPRQLCA
jgi:hypothetical protein